jgi:hypothetical protein
MKDGVNLFLMSIRFFIRYPISIVPLIICWSIFAPVILYFKFYFNWDMFNTAESLIIIFLIYFGASFLIGISCLILLEIAQQVESEEEINLSKALKDCFLSDFIKAFPVLIIWSIIWFVLVVIQALFSKKKSSDKGEDEKLTAKSAAETLAGIGDEFSLSKAFFNALQKGVRMIVFLILPAVAWEELSPLKAIKKGLNVFRNNIPEFLTGFALTELFSTIVFLPVTIIFIVHYNVEIIFPEYVWYIVLVYIAFAWSLAFLVEQLYVAELYLWHIKWENEQKIARAQGKELPELMDVEKPSFFDNVKSLKT